MGARIVALALSDSVFLVTGAMEATGHPTIGQDVGLLVGTKAIGVRVVDDPSTALKAGSVLIEFTRPEATLEHVRIAQQRKIPVVIGTTGLSDAQREAVVAASKDIPIVLSPNMSVGVNLLFELVQIAARRLGLAYDIEVVEAHHRAKQDAPSGTAKKLIEVLAASRSQPSTKIPVHSMRAGDIVGDHTVIFAGPSERLELTHRAQSRDAFAVGALRAAHFLSSQRKAGLYEMSDVLQASLSPKP